jgi:hypothetical protein
MRMRYGMARGHVYETDACLKLSSGSGPTEAARFKEGSAVTYLERCAFLLDAVRVRNVGQRPRLLLGARVRGPSGANALRSA